MFEVLCRGRERAPLPSDKRSSKTNLDFLPSVRTYVTAVAAPPHICFSYLVAHDDEVEDRQSRDSLLVVLTPVTCYVC